jgi:SDR family mycofactocin-dependent oxidoreductase
MEITGLSGKVALISGVARGQGRSHAVALAGMGAAVIGFDLCKPIATVGYPLASPDDLAETVRLVETTGGRIHAEQADVREREQLDAVIRRGVDAFGRLDIVIANAGIFPLGGRRRLDPQCWHDAIDVMLTGTFNTVLVSKEYLLRHGDGGSIVIISSTAGLKGQPADGSTGALGYVASKHGVVGLMRAWATELAPHKIRVNSIHPCGVNTPMVRNERFQRFVNEHPEVASSLANLMPVSVIEPEDVSSAVAFLVSDMGRYVTGQTLSVDAGYGIR